jgi:CubicO group peptidase (beta-lactamase class C family)
VLLALLGGIATRDGTVALSALGRFDPTAWRDTIEHATGQHYAQLLSHRVWAPLNAAAGWIALPSAGAAVPVNCCFHARIQDWLRLGALLVDGGSFEGTRVVEASWVDRMRQPASGDGKSGLGIELAAAAHGSAPFAAGDALFLRGPERWRLWAVPSLHLVVLFGSELSDTAGPAGADAAARQKAAPAGTAGRWDETRLPDLVIEAVTDRTAPQNPESLLEQLVPHH